MHFCSNCHNMYYLKIRDEDGGNSLNYYCRNCGHEDTTLTAEAICVSETQLRRSEQKFTHMVNEYTKFDPTLPRINTIKCPNQECSSNGGKQSGGMQSGTSVQSGGMQSGTSVQSGGSGELLTAQAVADNAQGVSDKLQATLDGGAGKKKTEVGEEDTAATKKKTAAANKNKTAKTLVKEAQESAKESAKEAAQSAKEAAVIAKELDQEVEEIALKSKKPTTLKEKNDNGREVIYIRYDDINMKYVYLCVHCDTTWKTDNRV